MMKVAGLAAALALGGSAALANDLNLTCTINGQSNPMLGANAVVTYTITGVLGDATTEGLALVGLDLDFSGGDLSPANAPTTLPMTNFDRPDGITNPAGYGGTVIGGNLVQVGGGQNTIKNTIANAPFPIGMVNDDVAKPGFPQVIVTGSLTVPASGGPYTLAIENVFANVIKLGETGTVFFATEQANVGTITDCVITIGNACAASIVSAVPANNTIDGRQPHAIDLANPGQSFMSVNIDMPACSVATAAPADFTITETGGTAGVPSILSVTPVDADTVALTLSAAIEAGTWTTITHTASATDTCVGNLPGNVNTDLTSNTTDATALIAVLNGGASTLVQSDTNRSGVTNAEDLTQLMNLLNGASAFTPWLNISLPATPCT